jgi:hypothetical protein
VATGDDLLRHVERDLERLRRRLASTELDYEFHSQRAELEMLQSALRPLGADASPRGLNDLVETYDTAIDELRRLGDAAFADLIRRLEQRRGRCMRRLRAYRQVGVE